MRCTGVGGKGKALCYTSTVMQRRKEDAQHGATVITISTGTIFRVILIGFAAWFLYVIRDIVALVLVALLIAAVIDPFAERMKRYRIPRGLAVAFLYAVGLALLGVAALIIVPPMITELTQVGDFFAPCWRTRRLVTCVQCSKAVRGRRPLQILRRQSNRPVSCRHFRSLAKRCKVRSARCSRASWSLSWRFTWWWRNTSCVAALQCSHQRTTNRSSRSCRSKCARRLVRGLRGQLLIMLAIAVLDYVALTALGIPYALVLAIFGGLMEVVPFLGPNVAVIPAALVAVTVSPVHGVLVMAAFFVIQQIESTVLTPKIMQKTTGLNPIVTIVAILIGFPSRRYCGCSRVHSACNDYFRLL